MHKFIKLTLPDDMASIYIRIDLIHTVEVATQLVDDNNFRTVSWVGIDSRQTHTHGYVVAEKAQDIINELNLIREMGNDN